MTQKHKGRNEEENRGNEVKIKLPMKQKSIIDFIMEDLRRKSLLKDLQIDFLL